MEKIGGIVTFRPLVRYALVALSLLFFSACTGESAGQSAWTTIDRPVFEVREVPERGVLYLDFGPVSECRGYWILPGNERSGSSEFTSTEWGFRAKFLHEIAEGTYEGFQLKDCFGVRFTTDVDALRRAAVKSSESQGNLLKACKDEAWAGYWKEYEEQWVVPVLKMAEDRAAGIENDWVWKEVHPSMDEVRDLAYLECERIAREQG